MNSKDGSDTPPILGIFQVLLLLARLLLKRPLEINMISLGKRGNRVRDRMRLAQGHTANQNKPGTRTQSCWSLGSFSLLSAITTCTVIICGLSLLPQCQMVVDPGITMSSTAFSGGRPFRRLLCRAESGAAFRALVRLPAGLGPLVASGGNSSIPKPQSGSTDSCQKT